MITPVMIRRWPPKEGGRLVVLFPTLPAGTSPYLCVSYDDEGEVGSLDPMHVLKSSFAAKAGEADVDELLRQLQSDAAEEGEKLEIRNRYDRRWLDMRREAIAAKP